MPGALRVTTDRATYRPGDTLMVTLTLTNAGPDTARWRFSTGQRYDVAILAADGAPVWRWGAERMFMQMLGEEWLAPGDSLVYREPAPAPSGPGRYTVEGRIPALDAPLAARVEVIVEG